MPTTYHSTVQLSPTGITTANNKSGGIEIFVDPALTTAAHVKAAITSQSATNINIITASDGGIPSSHERAFKDSIGERSQLSFSYTCRSEALAEFTRLSQTPSSERRLSMLLLPASKTDWDPTTGALVTTNGGEHTTSHKDCP